MTQELIYTSAPKGLQLGSRGFCTVACTAGMAKPLADRLEALSGYKHLYPPGGESSHLNPVNYSFVTFKLGGKTYYVLSRIADAGLDYTQRSNKLAHHVVLEGSELPPAGPAWLMRQPGFFVTSWEGEPRPIEPRRLPLSSDPGPRKCDVWQSITGDAGWGGVLAGNDEVSGSMDANILFAPPGEKLLELVDEAQALLPPSKRWGATFSTYYSKLPPGVECHWRFLARDSADAIVAKRSHGTLVVDLLARERIQQESDIISAARTGKAPVLSSEHLASATKPTPPNHHNAVDRNQKWEANPEELHYEVAIGSTAPPVIPRVPKLPTVAHQAQTSIAASKSMNLAYIGAIVVAGVAVIGIGYGLYLNVRPTRSASRIEIAALPSEQLQPKAAVPQSPMTDAPTEEDTTKKARVDDDKSSAPPIQQQPPTESDAKESTIPPFVEPPKDERPHTDASAGPDTALSMPANASTNAPTENNPDALKGILPSVTLPPIIKSAMSKGHATEANIGSIASDTLPIQLALLGLSPDTTLAIHRKTASQWDIAAHPPSNESPSVIIASIISSKGDDARNRVLNFSWNGTSASNEILKEICSAGLLVNIQGSMTSMTCVFKAPDSREPPEPIAIPLVQLAGRLRNYSETIAARPSHQGILLEAKFTGLPGIDPSIVHSTRVTPDNSSTQPIKVQFGPDKAWGFELTLGRRKQNSLDYGFSINGEQSDSYGDWEQFERDFKTNVKKLKQDARIALNNFHWVDNAQHQNALVEFDRQSKAGVGNYESILSAATNYTNATGAQSDESLKARETNLANLNALFAQIHAWENDKDLLKANFSLHIKARAELLSQDSAIYFADLLECGDF